MTLLSRLGSQWTRLAGPVVLLGAWELASRMEWVRPVFFPPPTQILADSTALFDSSSGLNEGLSTTAVRLVAIVVLSIVLGVSTGLMLAAFKRAARGFEMVLAFFYPIPAILFLPLIAFVAGRGEATIIFTALVTPYIIISIYTIVGIREIHPTLLEVGQNYDASGWRHFLRVLIPGSLPVILAGIRIGLGYSVITLIATEMVGAATGLGAYLWESWQILRVTDMYVALLAIAVIGSIVSFGFDSVAKRLVPWKAGV